MYNKELSFVPEIQHMLTAYYYHCQHQTHSSAFSLKAKSSLAKWYPE